VEEKYAVEPACRGSTAIQMEAAAVLVQQFNNCNIPVVTGN